VELFLRESKFDDAHTHIEQAKSHVINDAYLLGRVAELQARTWYEQDSFKEATSAALHAIEIYEKLGAAGDLADCRTLLWIIEEADGTPVYLW
jgi:hypothetical protein